MKYLSVCSGIEAATAAWHPLGWEPVGFAEIEAFPAAVLNHHYPSVKNFGDMTKYKEWNLGTVELLVGGTPCQSFSVAGLRKGLADPRGNLALVYCGILDHFRPKWFVWENVPGVLSSNGGRDFGSFLGALVELRYGFAYRVLDAQYFGVAQRRRRVFVVGYLGDWRPAAAVLFEPESVRGHPAPSRKAGQKVAGTFTARARSGGWSHDPNLAAGGYMQPVAMSSGQAGAEIRTDGGEPTLTYLHEAPIVAGALCKETFSGGMGGRPDSAAAAHVLPVAIQGNLIGRNAGGPNGVGASVDGTMYTLTKADVHGVAQPIVYDTTNITSPQNGSNPQPGDPCFTLAKGQHPPLLTQPIAFSRNDDGRDATNDLSPTMRVAGRAGGMLSVAQPIPFGVAEQPDVGHCLRSGASKADKHESTTYVAQPTAAFKYTMGAKARGIGYAEEQSPTFDTKPDSIAVMAPTLTATNDPSRSPQSTEVTNQVVAVHAASMAVRRLTPVECERLQGFPDNYTNIPWRKQPESPDGPRYKALGNSMAVPVMAWIGKRIAEYEQQADRSRA